MLTLTFSVNEPNWPMVCVCSTEKVAIDNWVNKVDRNSPADLDFGQRDDQTGVAAPGLLGMWWGAWLGGWSANFILIVILTRNFS